MKHFNSYYFGLLIIALIFLIDSDLPAQQSTHAQDKLVTTVELKRAERLLGKGEFRKALIICENILHSPISQTHKDIWIRTIFTKAKIRGKQGYLAESLENLQHVLSYYKIQGMLLQQVEVYAEMVQYATDVSLKLADAYFEKAKGLCQLIHDKTEQKRALATLLRAAISPLSAHRDFRQVIGISKRASTLYQELGDIKQQADALIAGAPALLHLGENDEFLNTLYRAEKLYRQIGDSSGISKVYLARGMQEMILGEYAGAEKSFQQGLIWQERSGNKAQAVRYYSLLGNLYYGVGDSSRSHDYWMKGLTLAREIGSIGDEIWLSSSLAELYGQTEKNKALSILKDTLQLVDQAGNRAAKADTLYSLGDLLVHLERYQEAFGVLEQALMAADLADRPEKATAIRMSLISLYSKMNEYEKALSLANRYVQELQNAATPWLLPNAFALRAGILERLQKLDQALEDYKTGIAIAHQLGDRVSVANLSQNSATIYASRGEYEKALEMLFQAEQVLTEIGKNEVLRATIFMHMGEVLLRLARYDHAILCLTESLDLAEKARKWNLAADLSYILGTSYQLMNHPYSAIKFFQMALSYYEENGLLAEASKIYDALATSQKSLGHYKAALQNLARAIDAFEKARSKAKLSSLKIALQSKFASLYDSMIYECLIRQDAKLAFSYAERQKSRALLDLIGNQKIRPKKTIDAQLAEEEKRLLAHLVSLSRAQKTGELKKAYQDYEVVLDRIRALDPAYASLKSVNTLPLKQIQDMLDPDTALLEYHTMEYPSLGPRKGETICSLNIFVVTKQSIHVAVMFGLPGLTQINSNLGPQVDFIYVPQKQLDCLSQLVSELTEIMGSNARLSKRLNSILTTFYDILIKPVEPYLAEKKHLCIVPNGILHHIPFAALRDNHGYLVERFSISLAPSASVLRYAFENEKTSGKKKLIFADEDSLLFARAEAKEIHRLFPDALILIGDQATKTNLLQTKGKFKFIHIATHGRFLQEAPLLSYLKFGSNGEQLQVREVYNLDLRSSLITLSGCETGCSIITTGEDLVGLTNAFLYAGAASLVVSLWQVHDPSTAMLMGHFYRNLVGYSKAEALRRAQLELLKSKKYNSPYYWAPFFLVGAWQ